MRLSTVFVAGLSKPNNMKCLVPTKSTRSFCSCPNKTTSIKRVRFLSTSSTPIQKAWKKIFEDHAKRNNIGPQDWYQVDTKNLDEKTNLVLQKEFKGSTYRALSTIFPEVEWKPWRFKHEKVPRNFWAEQSNQRKFFDDLGQKIGIQTLDDWYEKLTIAVMVEHGGNGLVQKHNSSVSNAIMVAYPEHNWIPWKFKNAPMNFWKSVSNQRMYLDWLGKELGVEELDDWYQKVSCDVIQQYGGSGLLHRYNSSPASIIMTAYPEHNWIPWKFSSTKRSYWLDNANKRKFFGHVAKQIGIQHLDEWYEKLSQDLVLKHGGGRVVAVSPATALMAAYPEHNWIPWKFRTTPRGFFNSKEHVKSFLAELSEKLSIQTLDDWYRVNLKILHDFGAYQLLTKYKGLYNLLKEQYPHHPWDPKRFKQVGKKSQRWLAVTLKKMFPDEGNLLAVGLIVITEILEDYQHPKAFPATKRPMQLDVFIPSKSLAFEYQGIQHYSEVAGVFNPLRTYQQRDEEKRALCTANNIKLIEVPYWWNRTQEELQQIINQQSSSQQPNNY